MRIFLDANILFSAVYSDGAMRSLLAMLIAARHELCADNYVVEEAKRNLTAKSPSGLNDLEAVLRTVTVSRVAADNSLQAGLPLPEKDRPVLASAIAQRCHALVTGDRTHFGALYGETVPGVRIYSPRGIAEAVLG